MPAQCAICGGEIGFVSSTCACPRPIDEELNHQAYMDVLDCLPPQSTNKDYLEYYHRWSNLAGEKHFNSHA